MHSELTARILVLAGRILGFWFLFPAVALAAGQAGGSPTAAEFARLMELHDFWRRASDSPGDRMPLPAISELAAVHSELTDLDGYDCIHMDYGNRRRQRDPMHGFSLLELRFRDLASIPRATAESIQVYRFDSPPDGRPGIPSDEVFPLWLYSPLVPQGFDVRWEYLEYISWRAIREGTTVFVVYTHPVAYMVDLDARFDLLCEYVRADSEAKMSAFIARLHRNREESPIDYGAVTALQRMLEQASFDPGGVDGRWGPQTERALAGLLDSIGQPCGPAAQLSLNVLRKCILDFQRTHGLQTTGWCDSTTIEALRDEYQRVATSTATGR